MNWDVRFADPEFPNKAFSGRHIYVNASDASPATPVSASTRPMSPLWEKGLSKEEVDRIYSPASMGRCAINPDSGLDGMKTGIPIPQKAERYSLLAAAWAAFRLQLPRQSGHKGDA